MAIERRLIIVEYEDYQKASKEYDSTRVPVGVEITLKVFAKGMTPVSEQTVLDAGCGTGSYLHAVAGKIGKLHGLDLNAGMLEQAANKTKSHPNVSLKEGSITDLPYKANFFDGILCNQAIHHVSDQHMERDNFSAVRQMVESAHRTLKPGGALIFNISSHNQYRNGFWWASLIPEAIEKIIGRSPSLNMLTQIMEESGFERIDMIVPTDAVLQGEDYFDAAGPLKPSWRDGDSTWHLASNEELARAIETVTKHQANGRARQYMEKHDEQRKQIGQTTSLFGCKI